MAVSQDAGDGTRCEPGRLGQIVEDEQTALERRFRRRLRQVAVPVAGVTAFLARTVTDDGAKAVPLWLWALIGLTWGIILVMEVAPLRRRVMRRLGWLR
jgi:hypothetical protein